MIKQMKWTKKCIMITFFIFILLFIGIAYFNRFQTDRTEDLSVIRYKEYGTIEEIDTVSREITVLVDTENASVYSGKELILNCSENINMEFLEVDSRIYFYFWNNDPEQESLDVDAIHLVGDDEELVTCPSSTCTIVEKKADVLVVEEPSKRKENIEIAKETINEHLDYETLNIGDSLKIFHNGAIVTGEYDGIKKIILLSKNNEYTE